MVETAMAARANRPLMILDLGVPRNISVHVRQIPNVHLSDIDGLTEVVEQNKKARQEEIPRALSLIDNQIESFMRWQAGVAACAAFAELRAVPEYKREALLRDHLAAISNLRPQERLHFMELLEKFLKNSNNNSVEYSHVRDEVHHKL
jgi:glutamyl-tRNA reductase